MASEAITGLREFLEREGWGEEKISRVVAVAEAVHAEVSDKASEQVAQAATALNGRLDRHEAEHDSQFAELKRELERIEQASDRRFGALQDAVSRLQATVSSLQEAVAGLQGTVMSLQEAVAANREAILQLRVDLANESKATNARISQMSWAMAGLIVGATGVIIAAIAVFA